MRIFFSIIIWISAVFIGCLAIIGSFLGAAFLLSNILVISILALIVGFFVTYMIGKLATDVVGKTSRSYSPIIVAGITVAVFYIFCRLTVLKPLPGPIAKAQLPANTKYWKLPTGSNIAYWSYGAEGVKKPTPIIFVHGGPGGYIRDAERNFFPQFTKEGYDVYLYDQPGAGFSDKLNMNEYTIDRAVQDIEAIRKKIGAEKVIIVGQSYGGVLGSRYVSTYPNNIEKAIFTSPGPLSQEVQEETKKPNNAADLIKPYKPTLAENIRMNVAMFLVKKGNKQTAENLVSQKEVTDYSTRMLRDFSAKALPPSYVNKIPEITGGGINVLANVSLLSDFQKISANLRENIKKVNVPVLVLRAQYDYIPWGNTREYRELYPNSRLVYIKDAGHDIWEANAKDTYDTMSAFILGKELPLPTYTGNENPRR